MSSINLTEVSGAAVPAPGNGQIELFADTNSDIAIKKPNGDIKVLGQVFGSQFTNKKKTVTETNTGSTFTNYDTLNLANLPAGNYKIEMRWVWGYASASNDILVRWQLDGAELIPEHRQEPKDGGADQRMHNASFEVVALNGNHTITVDFASSSNGNQARMYQTQIIVYRID